MKAKQTAQAAAKQAPVNKPTAAAQSEPRAEKKETQIEVDPIAKKITDIIYSEDNSATGKSRDRPVSVRRSLIQTLFQSLVFRAALLTTQITAGLILYCRQP